MFPFVHDSCVTSLAVTVVVVSPADEALLQEDLVQILPMVAEANAMAEELGKGVKFEISLVSPQARGHKDGRTEVSQHAGCS